MYTHSITADNTIRVKRRIKKYYEHLYDYKFDKLDAMDKFFGRHKLPKFIQENMNNWNKPVFMKEIEFVGKTYSQRILKAQKASLDNSVKHLRKK